MKWFLRISIFINVVLLFLFLGNYYQYTNKIGVLTTSVKVGLFQNHKKVLFELPKGLTVRDVSEQGLAAIDRFENKRFEIIITSDIDSLVNYKPKTEEIKISNDNLYSVNP